MICSKLSPTPFRSEAIILADELSEAADAELTAQLGEIAEQIIAAGYYCAGGLMDTLAYERP